MAEHQYPTDAPNDEQAFCLTPPPSSQAPTKKVLQAKPPRFVRLDVDEVRIDPRLEKCMRESRIDRLFVPSAGVRTEKALLELAVQEPIQVVRRRGDWWCVAGEPLLADARRILKAPRFLPMVVREDVGKDGLRTIVVVEQMIRPVRSQMSNAAIKAFVPLILRCARTQPELFAQELNDDQWADILRRSLRWFAAAKKAGKQKNGDSNGK